MTSIANFDFINVKVRARRARLYEGARLEALLVARDLPDLTRLLGMDGAGLTHYRVEAELVARHVKELNMVMHYLEGARRTFLETLLAHYLKENLKVIVRVKAKGGDGAEAGELVVKLPGQQAEALLDAPTVSDCLLGIHDPFLREGAMKGLGAFEQSATTFFIELGLDAGFFESVLNAASHLRMADRGAVKDLIVLETSIHNVLTVLRSRFNYAIDFDRIKPFLVPCPRNVDFGRLAACESFDAALKTIPAWVLPAKYAGPVRGIPELEFALWSHLFRSAIMRFRESLFDLGAIAAYFYIKRLELANLVSVVEGVRLGLGKAEIRKNLLPIVGG